MKVACVTGCGQDSSYITEQLLDKGYKVVMLIRRASYPNTQRIDHIPEGDNFIMDYFDLSDTVSIENAVTKYMPDVIFNLAAQSHVGISFKVPESTINYNTLGVLRFLEAIKKIKPECRFYQASSSEMFGISPPPQNEDTPFMPCSPYGVSKLAAFHLVRTYREGYKLFASNGILFNHESERRGLNFVTRKITRSIAEIVKGTRKTIELGNIDSTRDWGHSKDYMRAIIEIMEKDTPMDVVISTGETYSVRDFLKEAFGLLGLNWENYVVISDKQLRPFDVPALLGDNAKAMRELKWRPEIKFQQLVKEMLENDLKETTGLTLEQAKNKINNKCEHDFGHMLLMSNPPQRKCIKCGYTEYC
jgi:GDPmannose 4,6-dehydratase